MAIFNSGGYGHRGSGSPILQHFIDSRRFFSLFQPPRPPRWQTGTVTKKRSLTAVPIGPYGRKALCKQKPLSKRCQMAHTLCLRHRPVGHEGFYLGHLPDARIPASYNGYKMRPAGRRSEAQLCNIDLFHHGATCFFGTAPEAPWGCDDVTMLVKNAVFYRSRRPRYSPCIWRCDDVS
jgi:hypothetical protein